MGNSALGNSALCHFITDQIAQHPDQRITFAQFMEWALYHPDHGYYASQGDRLGFQGDFVTAPQMTADFGELLAEQFVQMWQILGEPVPFTLVEMGAGRGTLVRDILHYLHHRSPDLWAGLEYVIIERSPALIAEQQRQLQPLLTAHPTKSQQIRWCDWHDIPAHTIVGCCFSNELVDAFPVHRVTIVNGHLQELYVTSTTPSTLHTPHPTSCPPLSQNPKSKIQNPKSNPPPPTPFTQTIAPPSTPQLAAYFNALGIDITRLPTGYCTEVNLAALEWLETVASRLQRGYLLTVDYGYTADRYYSPTRKDGTLQCYYHHSHHNDPYLYVGEQDITAHVNFTALERWGNQVGLITLGTIEQALFLMALGLGDRIAALSTQDGSDYMAMQTILRRRDALQSLINPLGMGNFKVLIQTKGLAPAEQSSPLKGLEWDNVPAHSDGMADTDSPPVHTRLP